MLAERGLECVILVDMVSSKAQNYVYHMFIHSFFFLVCIKKHKVFVGSFDFRYFQYSTKRWKFGGDLSMVDFKLIKEMGSWLVSFLPCLIWQQAMKTRQ